MCKAQLFQFSFIPGNMWKMVDLVVTGVSLSGSAGYHDLVIGAKTVSGDKVEAPIGLSFACSTSSHFKSNKTLLVSGSIKFPGWRMQVKLFEKNVSI